METIKTSSIVAEKFEDIYEFSATLRHREPTKLFKGNEDSIMRGMASWYGTSDFEEAQRLLERGYDAGADYICSKIDLPSKTKKPRTRLNVAGFAACVPALMNGSPLNMYYTKSQVKPTYSVTINYERSVPSTVEEDELLKYSVKLLNVIRTLEFSGVKVGLNVLWGAVEHEFTHTCIINLKHEKTPLDILAVAYPLVHSSFVRRHSFRYLETCPYVTDKSFVCSYGYPVSSIYRTIEAQEKLYFENGVFKTSDIIVNYKLLRDKTEDQLIEYIKNKIMGEKK